MAAPYNASQIARWLIASIDRDAGEAITHLKLQKLIYYAQAWSLALMDEPLFDEDMQAWAHGPVAESVFHEYREYGWEAIPSPNIVPEISDSHAAHLNDILSIYGEFSAKHLERMTHSEAPWVLARGELAPEARSSNVIKKEDMAAYYSMLYEKAEDEQQEA